MLELMLRLSTSSAVEVKSLQSSIQQHHDTAPQWMQELLLRWSTSSAVEVKSLQSSIQQHHDAAP
jgi:hypothetical protein